MSCLSDDDMYDYEHDYEPNWSREDTSGDESDEEWQRSSGRDRSIIKEKCVTHGTSINLVHFLRTRETGERSSRVMKISTLLSFTLLPRWSEVSERDMLSDANVLLGRSELYFSYMISFAML